MFIGVLVGGVLWRVCLKWMRGATLVMWGAVGLDEVGSVGVAGAPFVFGVSPFKVGQGRVVSS